MLTRSCFVPLVMFLLFATLSFSASVATHGALLARRHHTISNTSTESASLVKRVDNAKLTYYKAGQGACGATNKDEDWVRLPTLYRVSTADDVAHLSHIQIVALNSQVHTI